MSHHPVRTVMQDLQQQRRGDQIAPGYLTEGNVRAYLTQRFDDPSVPKYLSYLLHQRTNGNPLFLVTLVDDLARQGNLQVRGTAWAHAWEATADAMEVPDSLRYLIERQLEQLDSEDQNLLVAASVAGIEFAAVILATLVDDTVETIETRCDALTRRGLFIGSRSTEVWPDETLIVRYRFLHALYQEILYEHVSI